LERKIALAKKEQKDIFTKQKKDQNDETERQKMQDIYEKRVFRLVEKMREIEAEYARLKKMPKEELDKDQNKFLWGEIQKDMDSFTTKLQEERKELEEFKLTKLKQQEAIIRKKERDMQQQKVRDKEH
jgi:hypothetical protein